LQGHALIAAAPRAVLLLLGVTLAIAPPRAEVPRHEIREPSQQLDVVDELLDRLIAGQTIAIDRLKPTSSLTRARLIEWRRETELRRDLRRRRVKFPICPGLTKWNAIEL
jgi:hypothetical protein